MPRFKVISYSNIMGECGYEVNDAHYTGQEVELPEEYTLLDIVKALKTAEVCGKKVQRRWLDIDNEHMDIYIRQRSNGKWLWELRLIRE